MAETVLADYELVEQIGETETTALFKGRHVLIEDRFRAIKIPQTESSKIVVSLRQDRLKDVFGEVCKAAAKLASALDSATLTERAAAERIGFIESVHCDASTEPDRIDYIIREWVPCGSLVADSITVTDAIKTISGVLEGLAFAHSRGIVHGNLKPSNLLLTPDGQPKIVEFGFNVLGNGIPPRISSVPYLSPEQLDGAAELTPQSDLFSVSLIIYEILTGRKPPRVLLEESLPSRINAQVPTAVDALVIRGLQTVPCSRFRSAYEMRDLFLHAYGMAQPATTDATLVTDMVRLTDAAAEAASGEHGAPELRDVRHARVTVAEPKRQPAGEHRVNEADGAVMVWVPAGTLQMGSEQSEQEKPVHAIEVSGFWIYKYPVTQKQFMQFLSRQTELRGQAQLRPTLFKRPKSKDDNFDNVAAAGIRWEDAKDYAQWAGGRLPTEAEWEWAARGPAGNVYSWGDQWDPACTNSAESGLQEPCDVGRFTRGESWCGALDMLGNVWEWCSSLFKSYPYDPTDGRENLSGGGQRTLRGGSANTESALVRASYRTSATLTQVNQQGYTAPSNRPAQTGFRLVKDAES